MAFDATKLSCTTGQTESNNPKSWNYFSNDDITTANYFTKVSGLGNGDKLTKVVVAPVEGGPATDRTETDYVVSVSAAGVYTVVAMAAAA